MADVNDGDIVRLGAGLSFEGIYDIVNVFHIQAQLDTGLTWAQMTVQVQDYMNDLYDELKAILHEDIGPNVISVANVTQVTTIGSIEWSPGWAGLNTGDPTAPGVCVFTWGRTYTPRVQIRKYFGVFGETQMTDGAWLGAATDACVALMDIHISQNTRGTGIVFQGVAYNRTLETFTTAVSSAASTEPAYQRRRKRGRGS